MTSKLPILTTTPAPRSARLTLIIPQAALMRSTVLPASADPFRTWDETHSTWIYRFQLDSPDELPIALHLTYICGLKWDRVVALGHDIRLGRNRVGEVLTCYQKSLTRPDYRSHCWTGQRAVPLEQEVRLRSVTLTHDGPRCAVYDRQGNRIPDPAKAPIWLHPCRLAGRFGSGFTTYHPASIREQLEANLMENDCHWCPHLDHGKLDQWAQQQWGTQSQPPSGPLIDDDGRL